MSASVNLHNAALCSLYPTSQVGIMDSLQYPTKYGHSLYTCSARYMNLGYNTRWTYRYPLMMWGRGGESLKA